MGSLLETELRPSDSWAGGSIRPPARWFIYILPQVLGRDREEEARAPRWGCVCPVSSQPGTARHITGHSRTCHSQGLCRGRLRTEAPVTPTLSRMPALFLLLARWRAPVLGGRRAGARTAGGRQPWRRSAEFRGGGLPEGHPSWTWELQKPRVAIQGGGISGGDKQREQTGVSWPAGQRPGEQCGGCGGRDQGCGRFL